MQYERCVGPLGAILVYLDWSKAILADRSVHPAPSVSLVDLHLLHPDERVAAAEEGLLGFLGCAF